MSKKKVVERVPARLDGSFLVKLECGHKRYTKSKSAKVLVCDICKLKS